MDTTTPQTPIIRGLSEVDQSFVRTQRTQNIPTVASGSVSPVTLNYMDFTPAQGITGVGSQHMRPYVTSVDDDDMVTECGDLDSGNDLNMSDDGMHGVELDKMRKQREQHFSQPRSTIEDFAPATMQQKVFYSRNSLTDEEDPEFGMIIDMDTPNDQWTLTAAFQRVLMYCSALHNEFNISFNVQKRSDMSSSQQHRLMEQCQSSEYVLMGFKSEKDLQIALSKRILI
ncbi:hypothetical protein ACEPPN_011869 [Leptodophora sp. 'Broadleaf-Isolate-01']